VTTMTVGRTSDVARVLGTINPNPTRGTVRTHDGRSGTAIRATSIPATSSCAISIYHADASERLCMTRASASTRCAALRPVHCRPLARSGSCPRVTCAITLDAEPIPAAATCGTFVSRDSSTRCGWTAGATSRSS
jgi:hypothetical protein